VLTHSLARSCKWGDRKKNHYMTITTPRSTTIIVRSDQIKRDRQGLYRYHRRSMSGSLGFRNSNHRPIVLRTRNPPSTMHDEGGGGGHHVRHQRGIAASESSVRVDDDDDGRDQAMRATPTTEWYEQSMIVRVSGYYYVRPVLRRAHATYGHMCKHWTVPKGFVPLFVYSCAFLAAPLLFDTGVTCFANAPWTNQTNPVAMHDYVTYDYSNAWTQAIVIVVSALYAHILIVANDCRTWFNLCLFFHIGVEVKVVDVLVTYAREPGISTAYQLVAISSIGFIVSHLFLFLVSDMRHLLAFLAFFGMVVNTATLVFLDPSRLLFVGSSAAALLHVTLCIRGVCHVRTSLLSALVEAIEYNFWWTRAAYHMMAPYHFGYVGECTTHGPNGCGANEYCEACDESVKMCEWHYAQVEVDKQMVSMHSSASSAASSAPSNRHRSIDIERGEERERDVAHDRRSKSRSQHNRGENEDEQVEGEEKKEDHETTKCSIFFKKRAVPTMPMPLSMLRKAHRTRERNGASQHHHTLRHRAENDDGVVRTAPSASSNDERHTDLERARHVGMSARRTSTSHGAASSASSSSNEREYVPRKHTSSSAVEDRLAQQRHSRSLPSRTRMYMPRNSMRGTVDRIEPCNNYM